MRTALHVNVATDGSATERLICVDLGEGSFLYDPEKEDEG